MKTMYCSECRLKYQYDVLSSGERRYSIDTVSDVEIGCPNEYCEAYKRLTKKQILYISLKEAENSNSKKDMETLYKIKSRNDNGNRFILRIKKGQLDEAGERVSGEKPATGSLFYRGVLLD